MKARDIKGIVENFDRLPDDAIIPKKAAAQLLGVSQWTLDRSKILRFIQISEKFIGARAGDIRAVAQGKTVPGSG
jgi:hypothetical protein